MNGEKMNQLSADVCRIVETIHEAFRDVEYPGDNAIAPAGGLEENEIAEALKGKDWRDIDARFDPSPEISAVDCVRISL